MKIKCQICNKNEATWLYLPGHKDNKVFFCDDCVPRGCSCNVYNIEEFPLNENKNVKYIFWDSKIEHFTKEKQKNSIFYEPVDEKYRRYPCCEYDYSKDGFDEEDFEINDDF